MLHLLEVLSMYARSSVFALCALGSLWAADPDGAALYKAHCATCHDAGSVQGRIPKRDELAARTPESIFSAMFGGAMDIQAAGLSENEGRAIARYLTGKEFSTATETSSAGMCSAPAKKFSLNDGDWNGWGVELDNSRYQPKPKLSADDVSKLKLKWAFGFPGDNRATAQPTVAGGRVFVGSDGGTVYSLDASTGCIYWSYKAGASVRTAISIVALQESSRWIAYFGDYHACAHAVDAETGKPLWKSQGGRSSRRAHHRLAGILEGQADGPGGFFRGGWRAVAAI